MIPPSVRAHSNAASGALAASLSRFQVYRSVTNPRGRSSAGRLTESDQAVVVRVSPVHDTCAPGVDVAEQVEVVADEFHLEQRLVNCHRLCRVLLLANDPARTVS